MKSTFLSELAVLQANAGSPVDLARIQTESLRMALEEMRSLLSTQGMELIKLRQMLERRTAVLSPTQGYSVDDYYRTGKCPARIRSRTPLTYSMTIAATNNDLQPATTITDSPFVGQLPSDTDNAGVYRVEDGSLRGFANEMPVTPKTPRAKTQVDLFLPPPAAFTKHGNVHDHSVTILQV
jgi:hypothetical protein